MLHFANIKNELDEEILWRYKELKNIKKLYDSNITHKELKIGSTIKSHIENTKESKYILRSAIPMIYAHWEGFFKTSITLLHKELDSQDVNYNKLNITLLSYLTKDKHTPKYKESDLKFSEIVVNTESNLSWKILEKFCIAYNFNIIQFEKYKSDISLLVTIRNGISHGDNAYHFDDFKIIDKYIKIAFRLMVITKVSVLKCLQYEKYYKR